MNHNDQAIWKLLGVLYKSHPWHGISPGDEAPKVVQSLIEVVPSDTVKYEVDKVTGYLKLDRPQKYSSVCPALYGFIPQTLCAEKVAGYAALRTGRDLEGDNDPMDICVLTDRPIEHGNIIVECIPIGGLRMLDHGEADDKIVAVLKDDGTYGAFTDISQMPARVIERLRHYFLSYKHSPDSRAHEVEITHVYGQAEAHEVISCSLEDYNARFSNLTEMLSGAMWAMR